MFPTQTFVGTAAQMRQAVFTNVYNGNVFPRVRDDKKAIFFFFPPIMRRDFQWAWIFCSKSQGVQKKLHHEVIYWQEVSQSFYTKTHLLCVYNSLKSSTFYALNFLKGLVPQHTMLCSIGFASSHAARNVQSDDLACACIYGYARGSWKKSSPLDFSPEMARISYWTAILPELCGLKRASVFSNSNCNYHKYTAWQKIR